MFRVKCPQCGGVLTIDERHRKVVGHTSVEETEQKPEQRLESILDKVQKSKAEQESRLAAAKERESQRKKHLEDLFKEAQEKSRDSDDDKPRGPVW
jgi:hypothetical protein